MNSHEHAESLLSRILPTSVVVLTAVGFTGWFLQPSYHSPRPDHLSNVWSHADDVGTFDALTTEDPLALAHRANLEWRVAEARMAESEHEERETLELQRQEQELERLRKELSPPPTEIRRCTLLLPMWQPGGDWPEDCERRIRARHAVVTALTSAEYAQSRARKAGVLTLRTAGLDPKRRVASFDAFDPITPECVYGRVVVLWLDESMLEPKPLESVRDLIGGVLGSNGLSKFVDVVHIGPSSSGGLEKLLEDTNSQGVGSSFVRVHSPYATEPPSSLEETLSRPGCELKLVREIGTDDKIAQLLVGELCQRIPALLRHVDSPPREKHTPSSLIADAALTYWSLVGDSKTCGCDSPPLARVAIIAEQDSAYGRQWKQRMKDAAESFSNPQSEFFDLPKPRDYNGSSYFPIKFELVPYIGIIDGAGAGGVLADAARPEGAVGQAYPAGPGQLDYLQRLELDLASESYDAIGIFGTDVYDALMILQALRPRFPSALFFTIDLDARFLHAAHLPYTRNLIVASHFGIDERNKSHQFRDVYEHSLFRSVGNVLQPPHSLCECPLCPKLYEIGRGVAVELNTPWLQSEEASTNSPGRWSAPPYLELPLQFARALRVSDELHAASGRGGAKSPALVPPGSGPSRPEPLISTGQAWCVLLGLTVLWSALVWLSWASRITSESERRRVRRNCIVCLATPCAILLVAWCLRDIERIGGYAVQEPLGLVDGVSAWPALFLRVANCIFCVWACVRIRRRLLDLCRTVRSRYSLGEFEKSPVGVRWLFSLAAETVLLDDLWNAWERYWRSRWILAVRLAAILVTFGIVCAFSTLDTTAPPVRGVVAHVLARASWFLFVVCFVALLYNVLEALCLASRLVSRVGDDMSVRLSRATKRPKRRLLDEDTRHYLTPQRLRIAADTLQVTDSFIKYPAAAVSLFILARAPIWDSWTWSPMLMSALIIAFALILIGVWSCRSAAAHARERVLSRLMNMRRAFLRRPEGERWLNELSDAMRDTSTGVFVPLWRHPLFGSTVVPILTYLATAAADPRLLEWMSSAGWRR